MGQETILLVDDEKDIIELLQYNLEKEGYKVLSAFTGEKALTQAAHGKPDLILLDLMLPGLDGLEVCKRLKNDEKTRDIPILMVTAKSEDFDIILGLEIGADDYITKPFSPKILVARIRALLRRSRIREIKAKDPIVKIHDIIIDTLKYEVLCSGKPVNLSVTEFAILEYLCRNPGWVFSRNQIINTVKGSNYPVTERSVDVQILGLRKKLGSQGDLIETIRGIGYRMSEEKE